MPKQPRKLDVRYTGDDDNRFHLLLQGRPGSVVWSVVWRVAALAGTAAGGAAVTYFRVHVPR